MLLKYSEISVVICAYTDKRWNDLIAAVESVRQQTLPAQEIVLVVDHNDTLFQLAKEQFTDIVIVENHQHTGEMGSRNIGVQTSRGRIIAFLDDDAIATPDWLQQIANGFESPEILGVGGLIEPLWLHIQPEWFPNEFNWVIGCSYRGLPEKPAEVRNLIGCNMAIRREIWDAIGGFQHQFGHMGEQPRGCGETEFCIRVIQRWPRSLRYVPQAKVYHRVPASRAQWSYFLTRCRFLGYSKAHLARVVGTRDGLSSEWIYTLRTLPLGVLKDLADVLLHGDLHGLSRAAAIVVGLTMTTMGYFKGRLSWGKLSSTGSKPTAQS